MELQPPANPHTLSLRIRYMKDQTIKEITISELKSVKELKETYLKIINKENSITRIFSKGRELLDNFPLYNYELFDGITMVAQILLWKDVIDVYLSFGINNYFLIK